MAAVFAVGAFFLPFPLGGVVAVVFVAAVVFLVWHLRRTDRSSSLVELHVLQAGEERRLPAVLNRASCMTLGRRRITPFGDVYILEDLRSGHMTVHNGLEECLGVVVDDLEADCSWNEIVDRYRDVP